MEYEVKLNRKNFKVNVDFDKMLDAVRMERSEYEYGRHIVADTDDKFVTEQEFNDDLDALVNYVNTLKQAPPLMDIVVVDKIAKKKDGWLAKGRVTILFKCEKTAYLSEEEYGYRCMCLKAKSRSANEIDLFVSSEVFKW